MPRNRFEPPIGDWTKPAFIDLAITAASADCNDRLPSALDFTYWRQEMPGLVARGVEIRHPNYAWDRMIGWQAGPVDAPMYGPFAQPPNAGPPAGWQTAFIDAAAPAPPPPPVEPDSLTELLASLDRIEHGLTSVVTVVNSLNTRLDQIRQSGVRVHL